MVLLSEKGAHGCSKLACGSMTNVLPCDTLVKRRKWRKQQLKSTERGVVSTTWHVLSSQLDVSASKCCSTCEPAVTSTRSKGLFRLCDRSKFGHLLLVISCRASAAPFCCHFLPKACMKEALLRSSTGSGQDTSCHYLTDCSWLTWIT